MQILNDIGYLLQTIDLHITINQAYKSKKYLSPITNCHDLISTCIVLYCIYYMNNYIEILFLYFAFTVMPLNVCENIDSYQSHNTV